MNFKKYFEKAAEEKIAPFEIKYSLASSLNIHVFNGEVEDYQIANDSHISGRGIYEGKIGSFNSDKLDSKVVDPMMDAIKASAKFGFDGNPEFFIKSGKKYKRVHTYNKEIDDVKPDVLIQLAKDIYSLIHESEKRITVAEVYIEKTGSEEDIYNSNGLKLKSKGNYITVVGAVKIEDHEQVESFNKVSILSELKGFDKAAFADAIVKGAQSKLGGEPVKSGKYNVIYDREVVPFLLLTLLEQLSSFDVSQHLSLFEGKVGQKVLSSKLSIKENPWANNPFASSFDSEGMPTIKKDLIVKGVLKTYLYDLDMAKKDNTVSTGNGSNVNGNIRPGLKFVEVKKGHKSVAELASQIKNGLYITDLEGIGTGLNRQSGGYSLQAGGYLIEDGKITKPVSLITVAGNILTDFGNVIAVGNDSALSQYGMETPSIAVRKIAVSGK